MIEIQRTNSENKDFIDLVRFLDADLAIRDGEDHAFYSQFNKLDQINYVVLAYEDGKPVGCGAIKEYEPLVMEVKRMFVLPECRGKGIASKVLQELENWAGELEFEKCTLETGVKQPEAIGLYQKNGYHFIPNYGQYEDVKESVCFEKVLG
ncbi:GNAT family N-acetyltransferase [Labilibaculum euxinus]|uniref:GNAT family N-acetyltransferase n=1 Tax=Labilibaculum euxinus TaxID=2686357 RepID=A0A7M4DAQ6_9BACT|nr:GNAT family N-acetyltransferase [Labilibaculum euxinus]MUP39735.1 GNAT family N-acetyltransferase [Labilibaculum euxinus]MVB08940.1 GNAT family N-acetyltransferase [Labilibaculum euxinus]